MTGVVSIVVTAGRTLDGVNGSEYPPGVENREFVTGDELKDPKPTFNFCTTPNDSDRYLTCH